MLIEIRVQTPDHALRQAGYPRMVPDIKVGRVLIYRIGSLGDTIVALPCFHLIQRKYPNAERILLTNYPINAKAPASAAVLASSGLVHGYMQYTIGTRDPLKLLRLASRIRQFKPDVLVYLMPSREINAIRRDKWFFRVGGAVKHIVGLSADEDFAIAQDSNTVLYEAEASRLARMISELGDAAPNDLGNWNLHLTQSERGEATAALGNLAGKPLIVCGPGTKMQAKDWGKENWRALMGRLGGRFRDYGLAIIGAKDEVSIGDYVSVDWPGDKANLCGRLTLRSTAAVFEFASVFVGPDSGPMHLAACAGIPCVIAFSARGLPGVWYPIGQQHRILYRRVSCFGCNLESCIVESRRCLTSITVEEMAAAVDSVISVKV